MSQITLIIDSEDSLAVRASLAFFETLNGGTLQEIKPEPAKQEPAKQEPAKQEPAKQEPAKQEPAKQEPAKQEPAKQEAQKAEDEAKISLNDLRALVAKKAKAHKETIRGWLKEHGYTKTPELPTGLYAEYVAFLNTLE